MPMGAERNTWAELCGGLERMANHFNRLHFEAF